MFRNATLVQWVKDEHKWDHQAFYDISHTVCNELLIIKNGDHCWLCALKWEHVTYNSITHTKVHPGKRTQRLYLSLALVDILERLMTVRGAGDCEWLITVLMRSEIKMTKAMFSSLALLWPHFHLEGRQVLWLEPGWGTSRMYAGQRDNSIWPVRQILNTTEQLRNTTTKKDKRI